MKIERIEIEGYRGINRKCSLNFERKSLLLFGANGTGKSSFVDALEKIFTGKISHLEGRMGLSTSRHGPNIINEGIPLISITFDDGSRINLDYSPIGLKKNIEEYLNAAREPIYILRRRQILDFIESKPHERYDILRPFLQIEEFEDIETSIRDAYQKCDLDKKLSEEELNKANRELADIIGIDNYLLSTKESEICKAISKRLEVYKIKLNKLSEIDIAISDFEEIIKDIGNIDRLFLIQDTIKQFENLNQILKSFDYKSFKSVFFHYKEKEETLDKIFYEDVLNRGLEWISVDWHGVCPLCETPWDEKQKDKDALISRIESRLKEMEDVVHSRKKTNNLKEKILTTTSDIKKTCSSLRDNLIKLEDETGLDIVKLLAEFINKLTKILENQLSLITKEEIDKTIDSWDSKLYFEAFQGYIELKKKEASLFPAQDEIETLLELRSVLTKTKILWKKQKVFSDKVNLLRENSKHIYTLLRFAEDSRKEIIQELFDELSKDIDDLYLLLNPYENLGNIKLEVRQETRGSANLNTKFYGKEKIDPRAYYSDAHLDSLGLCTFLALRKWYRKQNANFNLLVLDDVLTSIDVQHALRIAELILKEFNDYQIFLTTHDRIWFEYLRDIQARCRVQSNFINKIIYKWSLEEGPDIKDPEEERDCLDRLLRGRNTPEITAEAGRLLEHILQEMRFSLRLTVKAKRGEIYEIGEIWPAFYSTMRKNYFGFYEKCGKILETLEVRWPIRNWIGAHYNKWAKNISTDEVIEFGKTVGELFDCLFCKNCRRFIEPSMTPIGQLSCKKGEIIYPAQGKKPRHPISREEIISSTQSAFRDAKLNTELYIKWKKAEKEKEIH